MFAITEYTGCHCIPLWARLASLHLSSNAARQFQLASVDKCQSSIRSFILIFLSVSVKKWSSEMEEFIQLSCINHRYANDPFYYSALQLRKDILHISFRDPAPDVYEMSYYSYLFLVLTLPLMRGLVGKAIPFCVWDSKGVIDSLLAL